MSRVFRKKDSLPTHLRTDREFQYVQILFIFEIFIDTFGTGFTGDVRRYLAQQEQREEKGFSALAEQLAKWMAQQKGD